MGAGICSFVQTISSKHYFCYRHILESFGSGSFVSIIVRRLLFSPSLTEFDFKFGQALADLNQLYLEGFINQTQIHKLCNLFNLRFENEKFQAASDDHNFSQALWVRGVLGVSTCSNHSERINRTCNAKTKKLQSISERLSQIFNVILQKLSTTLESPNR
jgi:hypothetical protein